MPGPEMEEKDEDHALPTTGKMRSMLLAHEARIKAHFDQAVQRLSVRMSDPEPAFMESLPKPGKPSQAGQYKSPAPSYVRKLVEGTLKGSVGLGNASLRSGTIINSYSEADHRSLRARQLWLVYDISTMAIIFIYACLMGVNLQITTLQKSEPSWTESSELIFCILFSVDLVIRMVVERLHFFMGPMKWWNLLDTVLVTMMILSQVTQQSLISSMSGLRVLRLLRILRIMRLAKYFAKWSQFRQLRILVASIAESLKMMLPLMLLAFSVIYVFGLVLTEGVWQSCSDRGELLCRKFGTFAGSMLTLYQILYNGVLWGELWDEMYGSHWFFLLAYLLYVSFSVIILGNMMASFLFALQKRVSKKEKENLIQSEIESKEEFVHQMNAVFQEFDQNGNGAISWTEFTIALEDQRMHAFLSSLELDISDAMGLFNVLDADGTGAIEHSEFLVGCLRLRGGAKAVDMVRVQMEQEWMHHAMLSVKAMLQELRWTSQNRGGEFPSQLPRAESEFELSDFGTTSQVFPKMSETKGLSPEYRTSLGSEERAVSLGELKRISAEALLAGRHGWEDQRSGEKIANHLVNLYHFSYHHVLPKTAPEGVALELQPLSSEIQNWKALCGQQIFQEGDSRNALPSGVGTILQADLQDGKLRLRVALSQGRFSTDAQDGNVLLGDADLGKPLSVQCPGSFSYKEYLSQSPCRPSWYCSHWWGEPIVSFVNCCQKHSTLRRLGLDDANYWVCGYANRQHELEQEIGQGITESSFYKALHIADGLLLILDQDATPFSRIWCDYELYSSVTDPEKMLDIVTMVQGKKSGAQMLSQSPLPGESAVAKSIREQNFPLSLLLHGLQVCLEDGDATVQKDKESILFEMASHSDLETSEGRSLLAQNLKRANDALHSTFAILAWPQAMQHGILLDFAKGCKDRKVNLPEILAMDDGREVLQLSLAHFEETCVDNSVKILAAGLNPHVQDLRLSFEGCHRITDQSLQALAPRFGEDLKRLYLDFIGCNKLTDRGLTSLASGLPVGLEDLELHFVGCSLITSAGLVALRNKMPRVQKLSITCKGTSINRNFGSLEELLAF